MSAIYDDGQANAAIGRTKNSSMNPNMGLTALQVSGAMLRFLRMIFSEDRYPLFGIMRIFAHDLFRKPVPTFRDHA
jgi:hypothetical protein